MFTKKNTCRSSNNFSCNMFQFDKINLNQWRKNWKFGNMARPNGQYNFKNLTKSEATTFRNLGQRQKTTSSTKSEHLALNMEIYFSPPREETANSVFAAIGLADPETGIFFADPIGRFPFTSNWVIQYMLVLYEY